MPVQLKGSQLKEIWDKITASFDEDEIKRILRFTTDLKLANVVGQKDFNAQMFDLIEKLEEKGNLHLFLRGIYDARPGLPELCRAIAEISPDSLNLSAGVTVEAKRAAAGVAAVTEQLNDPQVQNLVAPHRDELKRLMDGIEVLASYKRLHDYLQTIQLTHQFQMVSDMQRLRSDQIAATTLDGHLFELESIYTKAVQAAESLPDTAAVRQAELRWLKKLRSTIDKIRFAVNNLDDREGTRALRDLRMLIRPESYRINGLLSAAADQLPLERLISTINEVVDATARDGSAAAELQDGLHSLENLLPNLKSRVAEHNDWQDIEREFILTDEFTDQGTPESVQDFKDAWPSMRQSVSVLAQQDDAAEWAQKSETLAKTIDANLAAGADAADVEAALKKARATFTAYRRTVQFHFFGVDRALRTQCEAILTIRVPLKSLLNEVR
jgi:hypothetical protein